MCIGIHYVEKILLFENITLLKPPVDVRRSCERVFVCEKQFLCFELPAGKFDCAQARCCFAENKHQLVVYHDSVCHMGCFHMLTYHRCLTCTMLRTANSSVPDSIKLLIRF